MIDAFKKKVQLFVFWDDQKMDAILLIIGIVYESLLNQYNNALISYFLWICF